jgi:uncharacterized membrane protein
MMPRMAWHYVENGKPAGPVDDDALVERARRGLLQPTDLIWSPDQGAAWVEAHTVPLLAGAFADAGSRPPPPHPGMAQVLPAGYAEGPDAPNAELTRRARAALSGHWGEAIGLIIVFWLVAFGTALIGAFIPGGQILTQFLLFPPLTVGACLYFLNRLRGQPTAIGQLFGGFGAFAPAAGAYALMTLMILGLMLAVFIPAALIGVAVAGGPDFLAPFQSGTPGPELARSLGPLVLLAIAAYTVLIVGIVWLQLRYALIFPILAANPRTGAVATLRRSAQLMRGRKWKLICLYFRFFGWMLLAMLTCGIGYLWLAPYVMTAWIAFYEDAEAHTPAA